MLRIQRILGKVSEKLNIQKLNTEYICICKKEKNQPEDLEEKGIKT